MLDDAASRREGQLFALANGDLVLLFPAAEGGVGLATTLARLFAPDAPSPELLISRWLLPVDVKELFAFLDKIERISAGPTPAEPDAGLAAVAAISNAVEPGRLRELLERQTGVLVALSGSDRVMPLFRELRFSLSSLEARAAASGHVTADPFLFRHLVAKLDRMMLEEVIGDLRLEDGLLAWAHGRLMLHLNMGVDAVLSPAFADFADAAGATGARVGVEIAMLEACADADLFLRATDRLRNAGFSVILDDVTPHTLLVTRPAALQPDLLKLDWSRQVPQVGEALDAALETFGPAKIILHKADSEGAMRWGLARGIRRFQGRHVDAILAAGRIATCPEAALCTLRKCTERENAATNAGRAGCDNLPLLDAAILPQPSRQAA